MGGGYLSIDEFIDQFTAVELERLERKDPLKRFSEKVAVQMTLRQQSPTRYDSQRSPRPEKSI